VKTKEKNVRLRENGEVMEKLMMIDDENYKITNQQLKKNL
jgi:hypothetical protein